jgi:hypothetical protein
MGAASDDAGARRQPRGGGGSTQQGQRQNNRTAKAKKHLFACFPCDACFRMAFSISAFSRIVVWLGLWLISHKSQSKSPTKQGLKGRRQALADQLRISPMMCWQLFPTSRATSTQGVSNHHGCHKRSGDQSRWDAMLWHADKWRLGSSPKRTSLEEPDASWWP